MKYLVTGVTGFIGSHFAKKIHLDGGQVIGVVRNLSSKKDTQKLPPNITYIDVESDFTDFFSKHMDLDAIIHFATDYGRQDDNLSRLMESNVIFPLKILEANNKINKIPFLNMDTYFGKISQYGYLQNYTFSKEILRKILKEHFCLSGITIINIVLEHVYGPFDSPGKFTERLLLDLTNGKDSIDLTLGEQKRDFVYIDDVVSALQTILASEEILRKKQFEEVSIGTGLSLSIREFVERAKELSKSNAILNFGKIPYRKNELMDSVAEIDFLKSQGWNPKYSIDLGLKDYLEKMKTSDSK